MIWFLLYFYLLLFKFVRSFRSIEEDMHRLVLTRFFPTHAIFLGGLLQKTQKRPLSSCSEV